MMGANPEDMNVEVLRLRPGDALAYRTDERLSLTAAERTGEAIRRVLNKAGHGEVPIMILDGGARLTVIGREEVPDDVRRLVIAAREIMDAGPQAGTAEVNELDQALEAFSARVPYADEPLLAEGTVVEETEYGQTVVRHWPRADEESPLDRERRVLLLIADGEGLGPDDEPTVEALIGKRIVVRNAGSLELTAFGLTTAAILRR